MKSVNVLVVKFVKLAVIVVS
uniref:Uncharacterized protein n=1 Tax=Arundo donax TaxID=35708 RepID=A0A0A9GXD1_ARUDO